MQNNPARLRLLRRRVQVWGRPTDVITLIHMHWHFTSQLHRVLGIHTRRKLHP